MSSQLRRAGESQAKPAGYDIVAQINGDFGPWQLRNILLIFLCKIPSAWFMACIIYTAPTPQKGDYFCKPSDNLTFSYQGALTNSSALAWVRKTHSTIDEQQTDRQFRVDACNIYEELLEESFAKNHPNYTNPFEQPLEAQIIVNATAMRFNVIPCDHFEHNSEYNSLVTQFDLVCSRQLLVSATQAFHATGAFIGGLLAFKALKNISPHRLMHLGMLGQIVCGNLTGLVTTFQLHVYFRCLTSVFCALMNTSGHVILADITGGKAKTMVTTLFELFWSIGLILLPGISIFFDSWSYLYVAISSSVIILVCLHRWTADSPRWLLRHNKIDRALQILLESATFNNREIPLNLEVQLKEYAKVLQAERQIGYWSIWNGNTERKYIFAIHWTWLVAALLLNAMLLMIRSLGVEHIHVNTASLGFAEMIGVLLGLFLILYTRRRWLWTGYVLIIASSLAFLVWTVPQSIRENRRIGIHMIFWIILKLANSSSLSVLTTCTGELVTTEKLPMLMLSVVTFSRIGLILGSFISLFTANSNLIPITMFASLGVLNGILMCFLNCNFWNAEQPRIQKVPTPNTYRRNSSIELLRRSSNGSVSNAKTGHDNVAHSISISDLWHLDSRCSTIDEYDSATEMDTPVKTQTTSI